MSLQGRSVTASGEIGIGLHWLAMGSRDPPFCNSASPELGLQHLHQLLYGYWRFQTQVLMFVGPFKRTLAIGSFMHSFICSTNSLGVPGGDSSLLPTPYTFPEETSSHWWAAVKALGLMGNDAILNLAPLGFLFVWQWTGLTKQPKLDLNTLGSPC